MIHPGAMLGVLGGGQLARMFALAAHRLGYRVAILDPDAHAPAAGVADLHVCAALDDAAAWQAMAEHCAAVTIETENVPAAALEHIAQRIPVAPDARALHVAQDRAREKSFLADHGFDVVPHFVLHDAADIDANAADIAKLLPGVLKTSRYGYDGKGQATVHSLPELRAALTRLGTPSVLEKRVALRDECSVILARDAGGRIAVHPVPLNRHVDGILDLSVVPAPISEDLREQAVRTATRIAEALDYRGVLCVEFFITDDQQLLVNEIAPRPHNSGHFTIDACHASQFEQQVRVLAGLPLGDAGLARPMHTVVMANLLGDVWEHGEPDWSAALLHPEVHLHLYGKRTARAGRKMGHVTLFAEGADRSVELASSIRHQLRQGRKAPEATRHAASDAMRELVAP
jgi:5-(carboxyamino)imidazole ribonucleotide synthase